MVYIKILNENGEAVAVEALENAVYVYRQISNGAVLRCPETKAQGILDATGSKIYQLADKNPLPQTEGNAAIITTAEYEALLAMLDKTDTEDTTPEIPEDALETEIMTRAELTAKVIELDEAMELLLSGVTE